MKVCFPIFQNQGMSSLVSSHFDSAPLCVIVDMTTRCLLEVANRTPQECHGLCRELAKFGGSTDTVFVVDGIGAGTLADLRQAGFKVYQAQPGTVADNLERIVRHQLTELTGGRAAAGATRPHAADDDDLPSFGCGF